jgi:phytoene dehydrogenase-like protein
MSGGTGGRVGMGGPRGIAEPGRSFEAARSFDAVVIGGGHNGLVCAALLADAGLRTLVVEARETLGGPAETRELWPGVRVPVAAHSVGRLSPSLARRLDLKAHGLSLVSPAVRLFEPESGVALWSDPARTVGEIRARFGEAESAAMERFDAQLRDFGRIVGELGELSPPDVKRASAFDAMAALRLASRARGYGRRTFQELFRVAPAPVADVVSDALGAEPVRALVAWRGVRYGAAGVRSAGTAMNLLRDAATPGAGVAGELALARGGPGALTDALVAAARAKGAAIRTGTPVVQVDIRNDRATGVVLAGGEEIAAPVVVSTADPKRTLLALIDPAVLGPTLGWRASNIRAGGMLAKVNLALGDLPRFGLAASGEEDQRLRGRIMVGASSLDAIERAFDDAKYARLSSAPVLEATIPSLVDPSLVSGREGRGVRHVMSVLVQFAPYTLADGAGGWDEAREALGERVVSALDAASPGLAGLVVDRQVLTPLDLEREYGLTGGHPMHAEMALDQFFAWRPMLGLGRYRLPFEGVYLAGSGTHPGGGITGVPGANASREIVADWKKRKR